MGSFERGFQLGFYINHEVLNRKAQLPWLVSDVCPGASE